jgi:hypothetical protein
MLLTVRALIFAYKVLIKQKACQRKRLAGPGIVIIQ